MILRFLRDPNREEAFAADLSGSAHRSLFLDSQLFGAVMLQILTRWPEDPLTLQPRNEIYGTIQFFQ
jgi:hypothetical protein